jgi:hypothetical protein
MGNVKKVIGETELPKRQYYHRGLWGDVCENLHIHYRNIRLEFSRKEWDEFCRKVFSMYKTSLDIMEKKNYEEGKNFIPIQMGFKDDMKKDSDYFTNRFRVEHEHDDSVHIHYRDIRLHLTKDEYNQMVDTLKKI